MHVEEIQELVTKEPFRPFSIRLTNGALYQFRQPRNLGATHDLATIVYFGDTGETRMVMIDTEKIAEIMHQ